jgi:CheY-like chemotaxis protein
MMPVMHGFEFMERLREDDRANLVPVVVLTAKELTSEERRFLEAHAGSVIQKGPDARAELLRQTREHVRSAGDIG